jgi:hypothetical protein
VAKRKGHIKDMNSEKDIIISSEQAMGAKNLVVLKLFEKDNFLLFVYKKTERIVSALYLMGDLLSDSEPIKWKFREVGIGIISRIMSFTTNPMLKTEIISGVTSDLLKILSFIEVAFMANLISEMNFAILKKELESLLETLSFQSSSKPENRSKNLSFDKDFFALPNELFAGSGQIQNSVPEQANDNFVKNQSVYAWADVQGHYKGQMQEPFKAGQTFQGHGEVPASKPARSRMSKNASGDGRQKAIMKLLERGNDLTIRDFSLVIKGCSEKTIQRELLRLVKIGVLKKAGERRWSRYSLAV